MASRALSIVLAAILGAMIAIAAQNLSLDRKEEAVAAVPEMAQPSEEALRGVRVESSWSDYDVHYAQVLKKYRQSDPRAIVFPNVTVDDEGTVHSHGTRTPGGGSIGYVGASLSDLGIGAMPQLVYGAQLRDWDLYINASAGRSMETRGSGTGSSAGSAYDAIELLKPHVNRWVIAIGTNDSAAIKGSKTRAKARIERAMRAFDGDPVYWVEPQTVLDREDAAYSDDNMQVFREALREAEKRHSNLWVLRWSDVDKAGPSFWAKDLIHLDEGKRDFADFVLNSLGDQQ